MKLHWIDPPLENTFIIPSCSDKPVSGVQVPLFDEWVPDIGDVRRVARSYHRLGIGRDAGVVVQLDLAIITRYGQALLGSIQSTHSIHITTIHIP